MVWLAGFLIGIIVLSSLVIARERAARRRRNRLIRSSIEPTYKSTRSQRSEMRGDSHHNTVIGLMTTKGGTKPPTHATAKRGK